MGFSIEKEERNLALNFVAVFCTISAKLSTANFIFGGAVLMVVAEIQFWEMLNNSPSKFCDSDGNDAPKDRFFVSFTYSSKG